MELLPIGPVVFLDTAGLDDETAIAPLRIKKSSSVFHRADVILLICDENRFSPFEEQIIAQAAEKKIAVIAIVNKVDQLAPTPAFLAQLKEHCHGIICCSSIDISVRERILHELKSLLISACPDDFIQPPPLIGDLVRPGHLAILIVPIDMQAPKGRIILPQVQTIRDALDHDAASLVLQDRLYVDMLKQLKSPPDIAICDSQVVMHMVADTPASIPCTTFSILFARLKGDLPKFAAGAVAIDQLVSGDRILIAESCSHHPLEDDIGRVKIPRWLREYTGVNLSFDSCAGRDFPNNLTDYALVVQCGGCMNNRREMLSRIQRCETAGVPITNYGMCISQTQSVLKRVLSPFPDALQAYSQTITKGCSS